MSRKGNALLACTTGVLLMSCLACGNRDEGSPDTQLLSQDLLSAPHIRSIGEVTSVQGVAIADLTNRERGTRKGATDRLLGIYGTRRGEWGPLDIPEADVETLFQIVFQTAAESENYKKKDTEKERTVCRLRAYFVCSDLCRDLLSRIDQRRILAYVLSNCIRFDQVPHVPACLREFAVHEIGSEASLTEVRGVLVNGNDMIIAMRRSIVLTPELLLDLISSGDAFPSQAHGMSEEECHEQFKTAAAFVLVKKLKDSYQETGSITRRPSEIKVSDLGPGFDLAGEIQQMAEDEFDRW
ncbi:MAG TPA: hypothetical protein PLY86_21005 [bacterium]|mgnify:CR=1 FL=1|nr:hypothetical protein [bacterium]